MTDRGDPRPTARSRPPQQRIWTLAQAALNADATVEQVEDLLHGLSDTLEDLSPLTESLGPTLDNFNATMSKIDDLAPKLIAMIDRMEAIVDRVERIVGLGEAIAFPLLATEDVVRKALSVISVRR
jgi:ABC-type transporter Mla subunit MlaD